MRAGLHRILVAAFLAIIATPAIGNVVGIDGADPQAENRTLASFPAWSFRWSGIKSYLPQLDAWFSDHFAFRKNLVQWYGISRYLWLGVSPTSAVAVGSRGWLYYADDGGLEDFTNEHLLTEPELQVWRETIARAQKWSREHGIAYAFTILPDKTTIYPEFFPQTARRVSRLSRIDQVLTAVSDLGVTVDVRQDLLAAKRHVRVFQKTDTHWNARGAYIGYRAVIEALRRQLPSIPPPRPLSDFDMGTRRLPGMDLAGMMGLTRVLGEDDLLLTPKGGHHYVVVEPKGNIAEAGEAVIVTEIPGSTLPRAVVFRDSFMSAMAPFFSEHFSRVVYLWRNDFAVDEIEKEHPDVVLQEIVGRHVQWFVPSPELIPD
jgi:hypothetical protein